ncbi:MAG TPA: hypothetical protein VFZ91_06010 [Allosphingosinicella sp.]
MRFETPKILQVNSPDGVRVLVDLSGVKMRKNQQAALGKIVSRGGPSGLTRKEWDSVKDLRARIGGGGGEVALIVRFDCKWVRIDEASLSFDDVVNPA